MGLAGGSVIEKNMSDKPESTVIPASEVKTTLTRSEQRKKNRQEGRGPKKTDSSDSAGTSSPNIFVRAYNFFVEAKQELGKVVWPTRKETIDSTWRLLILVIIAGIYLGLVDGILSRLIGLIL